MSGAHAHVADADGRSWVEVDYFGLIDEDEQGPEVFLEVCDGSSTTRDPSYSVAIFTPAQAVEVARALEDAARMAGYEAPSR